MIVTDIHTACLYFILSSIFTK